MTLVEDAEVQYCCTECPVAFPLSYSFLLLYKQITVIFREKFSQCFPELHQGLLIVSNKLEVVRLCYEHRDILKYILE